MIYTNKGMLLDKDLCDVIPCVCPLIDHDSRPMKTLEFLTLLNLLSYKRLLSTTDLLQVVPTTCYRPATQQFVNKL
jgi:hypothetical protein